VCGSACVPKSGACATTADCCSGIPCVLPQGGSVGTCGGPGGSDAGVDASADAPPPCALYGQSCTVSGDCCDGVPCDNGRCRYPAR
jgi:hypothetical protein